MEYEPLSSARNEIRLITLLPPSAGSKNTIADALHCKLEHVSINAENFPEHSDENGQVNVPNPEWATREEIRADLPESQTSSTLEPLWKKSRAKASTKARISCVDTTQKRGDDSNKPQWRFPWGDYVALSYVWGDVQDSGDIVVNDCKIKVANNLISALKTLRATTRIQQGFKIWVDSICIDQNNVVERSEQVAKMGTIYARAHFVVAWLGSSTADSHLAMLALRWLATRGALDDPFEEFYEVTKTYDLKPILVKWSQYISPLRPEVYAALLKLLSRSYWRRLWILQEMASAKLDDPVFCGSDWVTWREIFLAASFINADEEKFGKTLMEAAYYPKSAPLFTLEFGRDRSVMPRSQDPSPSGLWKLLLAMESLQKIQHSTNPNLWDDALKAFSLTRGANVTDERDRVYGILGLTSLASLIDMPTDYSIGQFEVYVKFSRRLLMNGHLNALRLVHSPIGEIGDPSPILRATIPSRWQYLLRGPRGGTYSPPCTHVGLPSWVVCWTCSATPAAPLPGRYSSSGTWREDVGFLDVPLRLSISGALVGIVSSLSAFHCCEVDSRYPHNSSTVVRSAYGDEAATRDAFWRTIVAGSTENGAAPPDIWEVVLDPRLWGPSHVVRNFLRLGFADGAMAGARNLSFGLEDFMQRNYGLMIFGRPLKDFISTGRFRPMIPRIYNPTSDMINAVSMAINMLAWRRLAVLDTGYLALIPAAATWSDEIFILPGVDVPLLLRRGSQGDTLLGECYVHGFMNGEVLEKPWIQYVNLSVI